MKKKVDLSPCHHGTFRFSCGTTHASANGDVSEDSRAVPLSDELSVSRLAFFVKIHREKAGMPSGYAKNMTHARNSQNR